ncbi:hypothetical protein IWQ56_003052 [Coemansia nantahalensis]|nr:hypothetical protein IWQ56_003052 [Coemansia nantahalensis]
MSSPYQRKAPWDRSNKYWCKYCSIFVFDNRSSRAQHESGTKHRDNVQKYLRQIGKDAKAKGDAEAKLSAQLAKIEEAAAQSYRRDVGGDAEAPPVPAPATAQAAAPAVPGDPAARRSTSDADAAPSNKRPADVGIAGAWEVVEEPDDSPPPPPPPQIGTGGGDAPSAADLRGAELLDDEDRHAPQLAEFEIREKTLEAASGGPGSSAATVTFKKRRAPANRATHKQRKL